MTKKLTIKTNVSERDLIEHCLNLKHSGYEYKLFIVLYALEKRWNIEKLIYYLNLIEDEE